MRRHFRNASIIDASGAAPFRGTVTVEGTRIAAVTRAPLETAIPPGEEVIDCTGYTLLPGLTEALGERLPDRRLRFRLDRNVMLADAIDHGTLDLAVMLDGSGLDPANASGIVALKWISSRTFAVPANEPLPVVMFSEPCTLREPAYAALDRIGVRYRIAAESSDLSGLYAAVRSGLGVGLLPMIGRLPDGLCLAEGLPPTNRASVFVRGRAGVDADVLAAVDQSVRAVLAEQT